MTSSYDNSEFRGKGSTELRGVEMQDVAGTLESVRCPKCHKLMEGAVMRNVSRMSLDDGYDYGETLGVVYDDFEGWCECDARLGENSDLGEPCDCCGKGECVCESGGCEHCGPEPFETWEASEMWTLGRRVVEAGLREGITPRMGTLVSDGVFDDTVECWVEVEWDSLDDDDEAGVVASVCCGHLDFVGEDDGGSKVGIGTPTEPTNPTGGTTVMTTLENQTRFEDLSAESQQRVIEELEAHVDPLAGEQHIATCWSKLGDFGDKVLGEAGTKSEQYEARMVFKSFSPLVREAFWASYSEVNRTPLGVDVVEREAPVVAEGPLRQVVTLVPVEDERVEVRKVESTEAPRNTFSEALDAEWSARGSLVGRGSGGAGNAFEPDAYCEDRELGVIEESCSAELNRQVVAEEQRTIAARRLRESLVVVDRQAVTLVAPALVDGEYDLHAGDYRSARTTAENKRFWMGVEGQSVRQGSAAAQAKAAELVAKLQARGVPVRTWRPDNRTSEQKAKDSQAWGRSIVTNALARRSAQQNAPRPVRVERSEREIAVALQRIETVRKHQARSERLRVAVYGL